MAATAVTYVVAMAMRISLTGGGPSVDRIIDSARKAEADGFSGLWFPGGGGALDPLVLLGVVGRATERIQLGTSIVQTYTRHPVLMAQQAATVGVMGTWTTGNAPPTAFTVNGKNCTS